METTVISAATQPDHFISALTPYFKRKRILLGSLLVLLALLLAAVLSLGGIKNNSFLLYEQNIELLQHQGVIYTAIDDFVLAEPLPGSQVQKFHAAVDGSVAAFLTNQKELYIVQDNYLKKIADDVHHYEISSSGQGIAFAQKYVEQYSLSHYDLKKQERVEITDNLARLDFSLSPDGKTVSFYTPGEDRDTLMCWRKGKVVTVTRDNCDLVGLANEGKFVYAVTPKITGTSALFAYDTQGNSTELGTVTSSSFKFNANHTQIMFYNNGQTLISSSGKKAVKVSSNPLYMVTAPNNYSTSDENSITFPVRSMFDHVYTCSDGVTTSAWLIRKNPDASVKLVSDVSSCKLDASAKYLYYIQDMKQLNVLRISNGIHAAEKANAIAQNVDAYTITSDRSHVYFTRKNQLICINGMKGGTEHLISDQYSGLQPVVNSADVVYYLCGSDLYFCKNGSKSVLAAEHIQSIYGSPNAVVYAIGENGIYTSFNNNRVRQIIGQA